MIDGKLVDGSDAPSDPMRAKIAQKKILIKYDKESQVILAYVSKENIFQESKKILKEILLISNQ